MFDKIQMILMMKTTVSSNRMSWWNSFFVSLNRIIKSKHKCFIYAEEMFCNLILRNHWTWTRKILGPPYWPRIDFMIY